MNKKFLRKIIFPVIISGSLLFTPNVENFISTVHAEIKMYTGIGESQMSEIETADIVKLRAREKAIKNATEKAGVALVSYSRMLNNILTDDEVAAITSTKYEIVGEPTYKRKIQQVTDLSTSIIWTATVNVNVDDEEIQNWLNLDETEKLTLINRVKENNRANAENDKKVEDLRVKYLTATTDAEKDKIRAEIKLADKKYFAIRKFNEGNGYSYDEEKALQYYTEAIELNPDYAEAYYQRGVIYSEMHQYEKAIENFNKAIQILPNYGAAYHYRGRSYYFLKDFKKALEDLNKVIKINPKYSKAYSLRANIYYILKDYQKAIEDYTMAIQIQPMEADNYESRAECYEDMGENEKARADFEKYENLKDI